MNTTTETRVPSPEQEAVREAPAPNLPATAFTPVMNTPPNAGGFGSLVAAIAGDAKLFEHGWLVQARGDIDVFLDVVASQVQRRAVGVEHAVVVVELRLAA